jgi:hypothetical protein
MRPLPLASSFAAVALAALTVTACAPMRVNAFVARSTNFSDFRTYAWAPAEQLATGDPRLDNNEFFQTRVKMAVENGLDARGLEKITGGPADVVLHYHASVTQQIDPNGIDDRYGYCEDCRPYVFDAGTLTLDMVDTRTNRLVWRGWAERSFEGIVDNQQWLERQVDEAVDRILRKYPVRPSL